MRLLVTWILTSACVLAQGPGPTLEEIREWSSTRLQAKQGEFKKSLDANCKTLRNAPHGSTSEPAVVAFANVASNAGLFPQILIDRMAVETDQNLRLWIADALAATKDPSVATLLIERATKQPDDLAPILVRVAGRIDSPTVTFALAELTKGASSPAVTAEAVLALAKRNGSGAIDAARANLRHGDMRVRRASAEALGLLTTSKEDIESLRKLATTAPEPEVRLTALRALARFGNNLDVLKALHDALGMADAATVEASMDALTTAGSKDLTPKLLLNVVKSGPPDLRIRAAKLMLSLGSIEGVKFIAAKERSDADKNLEDRDLQVVAGDRCREVGWYAGAMVYYDRALSLRGNAAQTNIIRVCIARCYARMRRFDDAKKKLKEANYPNLRAFADDADFADMRESPAHRDLFR